MMSMYDDDITPRLVGRAVTAKAGSYTIHHGQMAWADTTSGRHEKIRRTREAWTQANVMIITPIRYGRAAYTVLHRTYMSGQLIHYAYMV